jgi:hypothetical protein
VQLPRTSIEKREMIFPAHQAHCGRSFRPFAEREMCLGGRIYCNAAVQLPRISIEKREMIFTAHQTGRFDELLGPISRQRQQKGIDVEVDVEVIFSLRAWPYVEAIFSSRAWPHVEAIFSFRDKPYVEVIFSFCCRGFAEFPK